MMKRIAIIVLALVVGAYCSIAVLAASSEKVMSRTYTAVPERMYADYFENAAFLIKARGMYLVTSYRNRANAYVYACDPQGQLKAYLNMTYQEDVLNTELKITYDGPLSEEEGSARSEGIANSVLDAMEAIEKLVTVKATTTVSVRDAADVKAGKRGVVRRGDILELIQEEDKWWFVRTLTDEPLEGWVPKAYFRKR